LQVDEATDVGKDEHFITYVPYVLENYVNDAFLFFKPTEGRDTSLEVFDIINHFLEVNETCTGLCTDGVQSMSGRNAELQALVRKRTTHIIWTLYAS